MLPKKIEMRVYPMRDVILYGLLPVAALPLIAWAVTEVHHYLSRCCP